jgi:hypothetical protein
MECAGSGSEKSSYQPSAISLFALSCQHKANPERIHVGPLTGIATSREDGGRWIAEAFDFAGVLKYGPRETKPSRRPKFWQEKLIGG